MSELLKKGKKSPPTLQEIINEQKKTHEEFREFINKEVRPLVKEMGEEMRRKIREAEKLQK